MSEGKPKGRGASVRGILRVLSKQYDVLVATKCDQAILSDYSALLQFLRSAKGDDLERIFPGTKTYAEKSKRIHLHYNDSDIAKFSIGELENIINDKDTPRVLLERIAIQRFRVPQGSMRSFSNRRMLVNKLSTLIRNEQAHDIIDNVARGQIARASDFSED